MRQWRLSLLLRSGLDVQSAAFVCSSHSNMYVPIRLLDRSPALRYRSIYSTICHPSTFRHVYQFLFQIEIRVLSHQAPHTSTHTHTLSYIDLHFFCSATHCLASHCPSLCWPMLPAGILFRSNCHPIELSLSIYRVAAVRISVALWLDVKFPKFSNFIACFSSCISFYCNWLGFVLCCFCFTPLSFSI